MQTVFISREKEKSQNSAKLNQTVNTELNWGGATTDPIGVVTPLFTIFNLKYNTKSSNWEFHFPGFSVSAI